MSRSTRKSTEFSAVSSDDGTVVVEAATAAVALEEVTRRLGPDAEILGADKVNRGGVGGFFARELVRLQARPRTGQEAAVASADPVPGGGLEGLLAGLTAATDQQERTFAEVLRERLPELAAGPAPAGEHVTAPTDPAPGDAEPAPAVVGTTPVADPEPAARPGPGPAVVSMPPLVSTPALADPEPAARPGPAWSVRNLQNLGLPATVVDAVRGCDPAEDVAWVSAIAGALATLCRPLPSGPCVFIGPRARRAAEADGAVVVRVGERVPGATAFAVPSKATLEAREWVERRRGRRWLHLVVGDEGWRDFLFDEPLAVSWSSRHDLCEAVRISADLGLVLGGGPMPWRGGEHRRATPVELAMAVRDLLPQS